MNAHLSDSDRQALRLAQDLREEMRAALPQLPSAPSVSPFVDQAGMPSVLLRMDADTACALMALLAERRMEQGGASYAEPRQADAPHMPHPPGPQGPVAAGTFGQPAYEEPAYGGPVYGEPQFVPPSPGTPAFTGGTGPTPLVPSVYPTH